MQQSLGTDFTIEKVHRGGLLIFPTFAILRSLTVRMVKSRALFNALVGVMNLDGAIPYGPLAYNLQILARRNGALPSREVAKEDAAQEMSRG